MDFRSDPVGKLPFELSYQIFKHLEVYQILQARRVSRRWSQILSSSQFVEPLILTPWFGSSDIASPTSKRRLQRTLASSEILSPGNGASLQARHIDSYRNGTAFSMAIGKWGTQLRGAHILDHFQFAGSNLAWIGRRMGCIKLKCLISGEELNIFTPKHVEVRQIAISNTTLVAITPSGKCCAWDLSVGIQNMAGQSPKCVETHIEQDQHLVVTGGTVAILHRVNDEMTDITTWNIKGHQSHQFRLESNQGAFPEMYTYYAVITLNEKSVIFFERVYDASHYVRFTRMNLRGQIQSSGYMEHPNIQGYSMRSENATPVSRTGCVTLWSYAGSRQMLDAQQTKANAWEIIRVVYDTNTDRLELQRHTVEHSIRTRLEEGDFLWWKDVAYLGNPAGGPLELEVLNLEASVCKKADMSASAIIPRSLQHDMTYEDHRWRDSCQSFHEQTNFLLGNESFLISVRYVRSQLT